jgi:hypothetical protein
MTASAGAINDASRSEIAADSSCARAPSARAADPALAANRRVVVGASEGLGRIESFGPRAVGARPGQARLGLGQLRPRLVHALLVVRWIHPREDGSPSHDIPLLKVAGSAVGAGKLPHLRDVASHLEGQRDLLIRLDGGRVAQSRERTLVLHALHPHRTSGRLLRRARPQAATTAQRPETGPPDFESSSSLLLANGLLEVGSRRPEGQKGWSYWVCARAHRGLCLEDVP